MVLMIRTLGRHLRESLKSLGRNAWMTFASISAVTVTLILVGVFMVIMLNVYNMTLKAEQEVEVKVLVDLTANQDQKNTLEKEIKQIPEISSVKYSSKDEELKNLKDSFGEDGKFFAMFEQENPLKRLCTGAVKEKQSSNWKQSIRKNAVPKSFCTLRAMQKTSARTGPFAQQSNAILIILRYR